MGTIHELVSSHFSWVLFSQLVVQVLTNLLLKKIQVDIGPGGTGMWNISSYLFYSSWVFLKCVFLIVFLIHQPFHLL